MKRTKLEVQKRSLLGKKVKKLRREGLMPANIYGKEVKSLAVQVPFKDFEKVYHEVGETGVVDLAVDKEEKTRPVLIQNVQLHPVTSLPLHTDFHQVDLKEKITAAVPVVVAGEAPAVGEKKGVLLTTLNEVEVEALPTDLPEHIEVDVFSLSEVDQEIKVADLKVPKEVTVLTDPALIVCKIGPLITKEMEATLEEEKKVAEEAKAEAAAEAAPPAEEAPPAAEEGPAKETSSEETKPASEETKTE